jgi:hypothetical protein
VIREVWVLEDEQGRPIRSALDEHRAQPSKRESDYGYRVVRYAPAFEAPATGYAHTGPCGTGCTCLLAKSRTKA